MQHSVCSEYCTLHSSYTAYCTLHTAYRALHTAYSMQHAAAACCMPLLRATCHTHATFYLLRTVHFALRTTHSSPLSTLYSPLTTHYSSLTTHNSTPTTSYSLCTTYYPLLTTHTGSISLSPTDFSHSLTFVAWWDRVGTATPLIKPEVCPRVLATHHSIRTTHCLLNTLLTTYYLLLTTY